MLYSSSRTRAHGLSTGVELPGGNQAQWSDLLLCRILDSGGTDGKHRNLHGVLPLSVDSRHALSRVEQQSIAHGAERWQRLWAKICSLVCLTVLPLADVVPDGAGHSSCFELFGFDIMVDSRLSRYCVVLAGPRRRRRRRSCCGRKYVWPLVVCEVPRDLGLILADSSDRGVNVAHERYPYNESSLLLSGT